MGQQENHWKCGLSFFKSEDLVTYLAGPIWLLSSLLLWLLAQPFLSEPKLLLAPTLCLLHSSANVLRSWRDATFLSLLTLFDQNLHFLTYLSICYQYSQGLSYLINLKFKTITNLSFASTDIHERFDQSLLLLIASSFHSVLSQHSIMSFALDS